jgi:predicted RND superfamily exporter protein
MLKNSDVSTLVKLDAEFNAAVEHRNAAREAANLADFQYQATLKVCEHAINLKHALEKNRFHEVQEAFTPVHRILMDMQRETEALYQHADAAYKNAHTAAKKSFYSVKEARVSATSGAPQTQSGTDEILLKDIS